MEVCSLNEFLKSIKPWLGSNYIHKAYLDDRDRFVLDFNDGVKNVYQIDDCSKEQLRKVMEDLKEKGIPVEGI